jgi:CheY-like chemotaxis protein
MSKILIVDDKQENRKVIKDIFRFFRKKSEIVLLETDNGRDAIDIALSENPDLILMDINMETSDAGLVATRAIKEKNSQIIIWAVTSQAMKGYDYEDSDEKKCLKAGCDRYFSKPYDQKDLLFALSETLRIPVPEEVIKIFNDSSY